MAYTNLGMCLARDLRAHQEMISRAWKKAQGFMAKVLILYGTTQGQAAKIAFRIGDELRGAGHRVDLFDSRKIPRWVDLMEYDAFIGGASVHAGGFQRTLRKWVKTHSRALTSLHSGFFSVCLGILQPEDSVHREEAKIVDDFLVATAWKPQKTVIFAGALSYSKYNPLLKWWMRRISKKAGGDTDTTRDYEYTDWNAVSRFAKEFSKEIGGPAEIDQRAVQTRTQIENLL